MDLSVVIPCYNEIESIPTLEERLIDVLVKLSDSEKIGQIPTKNIEVLLVDDGSQDGTYDALKSYFDAVQYENIEVRLVKHPTNLGVGAALRTGFSLAQGNIVVTSDSDGTYSFAEIPQLLTHLTADVSMVTASPYHPKGGIENVPGHRIFLSKGASLLYRILVKPEIHTYTALFRAYRRSMLNEVPFESSGFLSGTELMVNGMLMGHEVAEYPAILQSRIHGVSKARLFRIIKEHLAYQWRITKYRLGFSSIHEQYASVRRYQKA
ncbi:MAG: glycosyltransferase family 2 protein [Chloroflexota bacterium]